MALYHFEVCMPIYCRAPIFEGRLKYGNHAREEGFIDLLNLESLPKYFVFQQGVTVLIEAETDPQGNVIKQVWRQPLSKDLDIIIVFGRDGFVRTVWLNSGDDQHKTLRRGRYAQRDYNPEKARKLV